MTAVLHTLTWSLTSQDPAVEGDATSKGAVLVYVDGLHGLLGQLEAWTNGVPRE